MCLAEAMLDRHFWPISPIWSPQPENILAVATIQAQNSILMTPPAVMLPNKDQRLLEELDEVL